jgi:hypothetical protein
MEKTKFDEVYDEWKSFENELLYENRFFITNSIVDKISGLIKKILITLPHNKILFRARIYNGDVGTFYHFDKKIKELIDGNGNAEQSKKEELLDLIYENDFTRRCETGFWGYDEKNSFVPQDNNIKGGRANPEMIKYLYVADSKYTALTEVRPGIKDYISIASIKTLEEMRIVDFSENAISNELDMEEQCLLFMITSAYSKINNGDNIIYLITQYISELAKKSGADGIRYDSAMYSQGNNYVIFNYSKCNVINSELYKLNNICFDAEKIGPPLSKPKEKFLYHPNLLSYKAKQRKAITRIIKEYKKNKINS